MKELIYIIAIAEEKSISKAAEKLYISQPSLSQCLLRVERECGTKLFNRTARGLFLTYAGNKYVETALKITNLYKNFENDLLEIDYMRKGHISIGTTVHLGSIILPIVLYEFKKKYPNIEISIKEGSSKQIEMKIKNAEVDIGLIHSPLQTNEITYLPIKKDPFLIICHKGSHLEELFKYKEGSNYPFIELSSLSDEKFILAHPYQRVRQISDEILSTIKIKPNIFLISRSVQTAISLVASGLGVSFVPESYVSLFNYQIVPNFCYIDQCPNAYWTLAVAYNDENNLSGPSKEFIRLVKKNFS
ncbi:LysR family transcriptional regulator [Sporosarcina cascadiensis]|uniref:LysR family transcriptional regulator n=1 Tax=Sporosarcina cascadiensis TaxID=2660747 RepID=UPI001E64CBB7|nr:LysR family transcriptional regulator [Sporosarcina cascadiensis]